MKVKRKDLLAVWSVLESIKSSKTNIRTTYTIAKNRNLILPEIEAIQEATKLDGVLADYEQQRIELCKQFCQKDDYGQPIIESGNFIFDAEGRKNFEEKFAELNAKSPEALEKAKEQEIQIAKLMNDDVDIDLTPFQLSNIPNDIFSVAQLEVLDRSGMIFSDF